MRYTTTPRELEVFFKGSIWRDMLTQIEEARASLWVALEMASDPLEAAAIRGELAQVRKFEASPDIMLEEAKQQLKDDKEDLENVG